MIPLLCAVLLHGQIDDSPIDPSEWLGKTDAQVVAMGRKGWEAYARKHHGGWQILDSVYAESAGKRNLSLLRDPGEPQTKDKQKVHDLMLKLIAESCRLGYLHDSFNGWGVLEGRLDAMGEDAFYAYLQPKGKPRAPHVNVSDVTKAIDTAFDFVGGESEGHSAKGRAEIRMLKPELRTDFRQIAGLAAKTTGKAGSDRILSFCRMAVRTIVDKGKDMGL